MRIPFADLGRKAADLVLQITHGESGTHIAETVPIALVRRGSA
jgi:DNA-binding LacI/PurR family transcriptional regulator